MSCVFGVPKSISFSFVLQGLSYFEYIESIAVPIHRNKIISYSSPVQYIIPVVYSNKQLLYCISFAYKVVLSLHYITFSETSTGKMR